MPKFADTQGIVLSAYPKLAAAAYLFLKIDDAPACKEQLRAWQDRITFSDRRESSQCFNIAFTRSGLQSLGLSERELKTFALPFYEGMAAVHRSQLLGDLGENAPGRWKWGKPHEVDLVALFFSKNASSLKSHVDEFMNPCRTNGVCHLVDEPVVSLPHPDHPDSLPPFEHFGFHDGMSQPVIKELLETKSVEKQENFREHDGRYFAGNIVPAGEFIFGYPNCYRREPSPPIVAPKPGSPLASIQAKATGECSNDARQLDFGRDGTYLVIRQIRQRVGDFWRTLGDATRDSAGNIDRAARDRLAAKIVGRWRNGAPLTENPNAEPPKPPAAINDFTYREHDIQGERCPIGAHIRRANPRDALDVEEQPARAMELVNRHRILRRGRPYGPWLKVYDSDDDDQERGLMFVALNVNLERQFEFIQNAWINNDKFAGLYSEIDPLIGTQRDGADGRMFTIQAQPLRRRLHTLDRFVQVVGGGYFFLPSRPAVVHLLL